MNYLDVFLSWSGGRSRQVAAALHEWLPDVLHHVRPWMSSHDVDKGAHWPTEVATRLATAKVGVFCLTPENVEAPWILFEAGAIAKETASVRVCTYLFDLGKDQLRPPLSFFQATEATKRDTFELLCTLNNVLGEDRRSDKQCERTFELWWPELEKMLLAIEPVPTVDPAQASSSTTRRRPGTEINDNIRLEHMVRTQLTTIIGYSELMGDGILGPMSREQCEALDAIQRAAAEILYGNHLERI
jgi:hypothetical protein